MKSKVRFFSFTHKNVNPLALLMHNKENNYLKKYKGRLFCQDSESSGTGMDPRDPTKGLDIVQ